MLEMKKIKEVTGEAIAGSASTPELVPLVKLFHLSIISIDFLHNFEGIITNTLC